jgi:2OG-Fe(II) oxygenase superfamily/GRF zinc finger
MRKVSPKVEEAVNIEIAKRIKTHYPDGKKIKHQSPNPWKPNAAFVNCYNGGAESVGYHSDQLTYLGPRAIIGSISLGVAREFRVRRIIPQDSSEKPKPKSEERSDQEGQIAIHLPHNSLLVMHAEMQEEWKHSIAPAQAIDPHPIAGNKRINITYRDYRANLHPKFTPRCKCDVPAVLRVVQRKKENWGRYFWMCHAGNVPGKEGCSFFEWAVFDDDGQPVWKTNGNGDKKVES